MNHTGFLKNIPVQRISHRWIFIALVLVVFFISSCGSKHSQKNNKIDVTQDTTGINSTSAGNGTSPSGEEKRGYNPAYKPQTAEITGYIRNGGNANVILDELSIGGINPLESVIINPDGSFAVSTTIYEPGIYQLRFDNGSIHLFLRGGKVKIIGDISNLGKYEVYGSVESNQLRDMYYLLDKFNARTMDIQNRIDDLQKDKTRVKELLRLVDSQDVYYTRIQAEKSRELKQFITRLDTSMVAILAAFYLDPDKNYNFLQQVRNKFAKICPNSKYFVQLSEKIGKIVPVNSGDNIPVSSFKDPSGKEISMSAFRGKNMLIYFWSSDNPNCRNINHKLKAVYDKYKGKGFEIYAISFDLTRESWVKAINEDNMKWINVSNLGGWDQETVNIYKINSIPYFILVGKNGKIVDRGFDISQLDSRLRQLN